MPTRQRKTPTVKNPKKTKTEIDIIALAIVIDMYSPKILLSVIEEVHSMPKQGVVGVFSFGKSYGTILGLVSANYIPIFNVRPSVWKPIMGLSKDKTASITKAKKLFPDFNSVWSNKKSHNMAEAALLASLGEKFVLDEDAMKKGMKKGFKK